MFWQQFSTLSDKEEAARLLQWLTSEVRVLQQLQRPSSHDGLSGVLSLFGGGNPLAAASAVPFHRYRDPWEVRVCNNTNGSRCTLTTSLNLHTTIHYTTLMFFATPRIPSSPLIFNAYIVILSVSQWQYQHQQH